MHLMEAISPVRLIRIHAHLTVSVSALLTNGVLLLYRPLELVKLADKILDSHFSIGNAALQFQNFRLEGGAGLDKGVLVPVVLTLDGCHHHSFVTMPTAPYAYSRQALSYISYAEITHKTHLKKFP